MAQVSKTTKEAALQSAISDGGNRDLNIASYAHPERGHSPWTKDSSAYVVVQVGDNRWVTLKDGGTGTWTEI